MENTFHNPIDSEIIVLSKSEVSRLVFEAAHLATRKALSELNSRARPEPTTSSTNKKANTYTSREVESLFNISRTTRRAWERKGLLRAVSIGGRKKVFKSEEVEALLNQKTNAL